MGDLRGLGASSDMRTELGVEANRPCHLVEITTDNSGTPEVIYATNYFRNLVWDSNTYLAAGTFLEVDTVSESTAFSIHKTELSLSGVDSSNIATFLNNNFIDQDVKLYLAMIDSSGDVIDNGSDDQPVLIFDGNIDSAGVEEDPDGGTSILKVSAASQFVDFQRKSGRRTTDAEQQYHYSGDLFYQPKLSKTATKEWGRG
jgi:hypothetical protein